MCHEVLQPLSCYMDTWCTLPGVSEWVLNMVSNEYMLEFAHRLPCFSSVMMPDVPDRDALDLQKEIHSFLVKQAIKAVLPGNMESDLYSRYILVPKKDGSLCPILDLRSLNRGLAKHSFKMITVKQILFSHADSPS